MYALDMHKKKYYGQRTPNKSPSKELVAKKKEGLKRLKCKHTFFGIFENENTFRCVSEFAETVSVTLLPDNTIQWRFSYYDTEHAIVTQYYVMEFKRDNLERIVAQKHEEGVFSVEICLRYAPIVNLDKCPFITRVAYPNPATAESMNFHWVRSLSTCRTILLERCYFRDIDPEKFFKFPVTINVLEIIPIQGRSFVLDLVIDDKRIPFNIRYLLMCVNTKYRGLLNVRGRLKSVQKWIVKMLNTEQEDCKVADAIQSALRRLLLQADSLDYSDFQSELEKLTTKFLKKYSGYGSNTLMSNTTTVEEEYSRRIIVMPLSIEYHEDKLKDTNRVLRKYVEQKDDFLRVNFYDDNHGKLSIYKDTFMYLRERIGQTINSLNVCGNHFEMLASSSSQLRSHGSWFLCTDHGLTVQGVIDSLGDFSKVKNRAKYGARIGLAFSTTHSGIKVEYDIDQDIVVRNEVDRCEYIFNDGIGRMSCEFAEKVANKVFQTSSTTTTGNCSSQVVVPSAIQFRLGAFKGVVVQDVHLSEHTSKPLYLSKNQFKLNSEGAVSGSDEFEAILCSERKGIGYLNKQTIALLWSNHIKEEVFMELMLRDFCKKWNWEIAKRMISTIPNKINENLCKEKDCTSDPFASMVFDLATYRQSEEFRIPIEKSCVLIGVLDYYGILEENEIFIQLSPLSQSEQELLSEEAFPNGGVLKGLDVAVTRSPCLHPGDIRKLKTVSDEEKIAKLSHLKDVVVFSRKGNRPQPNKMSGGDLDGDIFFVTWEPSLLQFEEFPPMKYTSNATPKEEICNYQTIRSFFLEYMEHDNLGTIANRHLELFDSCPEGARSYYCLRLANAHSTQVDFVKSGISFDIGILPKVEARPHFLSDTPNKERYISKSILGNMKTRLDEEHIIDVKFPKKNPFGIEEQQFQSSQFYQEVLHLYEKYKNDMRRIMTSYNVETEAELITGLKSKWNDQDSISRKVTEMACNLVSEVYEQAFQLISMHETTTTFSVQERAFMFYMVAMKDNEKQKRRRDIFGLSFYWIVKDLMSSFI